MLDFRFVWKWLRGSGKGRMPKQAPRFHPRPARGRFSLELLEDHTLLSFSALVTLPGGLRPTQYAGRTNAIR
jgi:hypothetical protein